MGAPLVPSTSTFGTFALVPGSFAAAHGPVKFAVVTFVGPSSYNKIPYDGNTTPTIQAACYGNTGLAAGFSGAVGQGNLTPIAVLPIGQGDATFSYDPVTDRLRVFTTSTTPAEVTNTTSLSSTSYQALVIAQ